MRNGQLLIVDQPVEPEQEYRVAGCDWELSEYGGYIDPQWGLKPRYELPMILRDVLEDYLLRHSPVHVEMGRLGLGMERYC
jgi:hypothetical protein